MYNRDNLILVGIVSVFDLVLSQALFKCIASAECHKIHIW